MKPFLLKLKSWWMAFAKVLNWFSTRVLLSIAYFIVIGVPALFLLLIRKDLLQRKFTQQKSYWSDKEPVNHTHEQAHHQF
ncbi:MAG: hypothetical protein HY960_11620 [Ignavibacteriae bacterium]|nr:hypothetical protein [Ignavibacteriota bacterium]